MIHTDPKSGRQIEVFTTKEEDKAIDKGFYHTAVEVTRNGEWIAEIECWFDNNYRLEDYDGVYELQNDCVRALRAAGYTVPREFVTADKWK